MTVGNSVINSVTLEEVPHDTYDPASGAQRCNGSALEAVPDFVLRPYEGIEPKTPVDVLGVIGATLTTAKYAEFKVHWSFDALMATSVVDPGDWKGWIRSEKALTALEADTSISASEIGSIISALREN